ncbi:MAG TPA: hypothetical protein G4N99_06595 [Thermoflexia bacterium]|nr:hypothetical protein [Thermoflexia bacterium]
MILRFKIGLWLSVALWLALWGVPLAIGLAWGAAFDDSVYTTFRHASDLAEGGGQALLGAPLYVLALWLTARLGISLLQIGLILSGLGWGAAATAIYSAGRAMRRPAAALVAALLVAFNPAVVATLGSEISWAVAWAWVAVTAAAKKRWRFQTGALALMLLAHLDWITLTAAALLLIVRWAARRRFPLWSTLLLAIVGLGWGLAVDWVSVSFAAAEALATTLALFLIGLGIGWIVEWADARSIFHLARPALMMSAALVVGLPLGMAQAAWLWQRYQFRPVARQALEQQAGAWLRAHTDPAATVFASERVGYLADRTAIPWAGSEGEMEKLVSLLQELSQEPPEYCVSFRSIPWDRVMRTSWFQDGYEPVQVFESPYTGASPLTIWKYRWRAFDAGERQPLNVRLPEGATLAGYKYWPARVQPGGAVYVTLFLRTAQPVVEPFRTVVRLISPADGVGWAQRETHISRSTTLTEWWQAEPVIVERFVLTPTVTIPVGAYRLEVSAARSDAESFLPIYQDGDTASLDKITLGYVIVPWRGEMERANPVNANLGGQINLLGFEAADSLSPGTEFDVTLYWEAQQPPEGDHIVFVHLLDDEGRVAASHDGPPMNGRYPTGAWLPGEVVPDTHHLALDPDVPEGTYRLQAGMYVWPSLERLPVGDGEGVGAVTLQTLMVSENH